MVASITCRRATLKDIPLLASHHRQMFEEMRAIGDDNTPQENCCGPVQVSTGFPLQLAGSSATQTPPDFGRLEEVMAQKLTQLMPDNSCAAWIADSNGKPVASGAVTFISTVPVPEDPTLEVGFLHSVFTEKSFRAQGIASTLLDHILDHCRSRGICRVQLHASTVGRSVYQKKGFQPLDNVMLRWL